jgi:hypothetical protein
MLSKFCRRLAVAACACAAVGTAAHAASPYVYQQSSPTYWGANGSTAILEVYYDVAATIPLIIVDADIFDLSGSNTSLLNMSCGTETHFNDNADARMLMPGQSCYIEIARTPASVAATVVMADSTGKANNIHSFVRGSLEIYDSSNNVLTHSELR